MLDYEFRFIDRAGLARTALSIHAADDQQAIKLADILNNGSIGAGYEIWRAGRKLFARANGLP